MEIAERVCCIIGDGLYSETEEPKLESALYIKIGSLIEQGITTFITRAWFGFDMLAAKQVLAQKKLYPNVKLFVFTAPFLEPKQLWTNDERAEHQSIRQKADGIQMVKFHRQELNDENNFFRYLIDQSEYALLYMNHLDWAACKSAQYAKEKDISFEFMNFTKHHTPQTILHLI